MSSKPKGNGSARPDVNPSQAAEMAEASVGNAARDEEIKRRAYEIYLGRGEQPGSDLDDLLQAERELGSGALSRALAG